MRPFLVFVLICLNGCTPAKEEPPGLQLQVVSLVAEKEANKNSALSVDLVVAYDKDLLNRLKGMTSAQYFSSVEQLTRDYPSTLDIWRWEIVPGQVLSRYHLQPTRFDSWGALFFADYQTPGVHRLSAPSLASGRLFLGKDTIQSMEQDKESGNNPQNFIALAPSGVHLNTRTPRPTKK